MPQHLPQRTPVLGTYVPAQPTCSEKHGLFLQILPECQQAVETSPVIRPLNPQEEVLPAAGGPSAEQMPWRGTSAEAADVTKSSNYGRLVLIPVPVPSAHAGAVLRPVWPGS